MNLLVVCAVDTYQKFKFININTKVREIKYLYFLNYMTFIVNVKLIFLTNS
jgi:hypothetical protein